MIRATPRIDGGRAASQRSSRVLAFFVGLAASAVLVLPAFRPAQVPLAYLLLILLAVIMAIRGRLVPPHPATRIYAPWLVATVFAVVHAAIFGSEEVFQLAARGGMALVAGLLVTSTVLGPVVLPWFFLGMALIFCTDGLVAIGQFLDLPQAWKLTSWVYGHTVGQDLLIQRLAVSRVSGIEPFSHVFSYNQGVWVFVSCWSYLLLKNRLVQALAAVALLIGSFAVFVAAQRSVVWTVFPALALLLLAARGIGRATLVIGTIIAILVVYDVIEWFVAQNEILTRLGSVVDQASDSGRLASLVFGLKAIAENPFFGNTSGIGFDVGIHNGFLNGWAKFGILWAAAFVAGVILTVRTLWQMKTAVLWCRFASVLLVLVMLANVMGHTNSPGQDDMTFLVALGVIVALVHQGESVAIGRRTLRSSRLRTAKPVRAPAA